MKASAKYLISIAVAFLAGFLSDGFIILLSKSPNGETTDFGYIEFGIMMIIGLIIGCTCLIMMTINKNRNS